GYCARPPRRDRLTPQRPGHAMTTDRPAGSVDPKLLEILVCPLTKSTLEYDAEKQELISRAAKLAYPIRDGIPIMLPEEARPLEEAPRRAPSDTVGPDDQTPKGSERCSR